MIMAKELMKGNVAVAEAALRGGMDFFAGYPITPSTETLEYLSHRMDEVDLRGRFIQAENEISAINMVMGASSVGARAMTASSGTGISLKAEGFSYAARYSIPYVCLNVQRWGCGLGSLDSGQADYFRDVKGSGQGDYHRVVYSPANIQELVDDAYEAWEVAERYRIGVCIFSEAFLGQMMEEVEMPAFKKRSQPLDWEIDGTGTKGLRYVPGAGPHISKLNVEKYARVESEMQRWESVCAEDAEYILVAYGIPSRVCSDAVRRLRSAGEKAGMIRPQIIWPYPWKAFEEIKKINPGVKGFISVETNDLGQMVEDVALAVKRSDLDVPVYCYAHGPGTPGVRKVMDVYHSVKAGKEKERF